MVPKAVSPIRISAVQMSSTDDRDRNLSIAERLIEQAARDGAKIVVLPENFSFLGEGRDKARAAEDVEDGPSISFLRNVAIRYRVDVVGGTIPVEAKEGKVSNTCFVIDADGEIVARYDKIHLFDVAVDAANTFEESAYVVPGSEVVTVPLQGITVGLSICYDLRFPEMYRRLVGAGAEVVLVPSAFTMETGKAHWEILLRARAIENLCYVVAPAQYGRHSLRRMSFGHSMIVGPWGEIVGSVDEGDAVVTADIEPLRVRDVRRRLPALDHVRLE